MMIGGVREMESMYENSTVVSVLGATRQSVLTDESTSMPRQMEGITSWAAYRTQATGKEHHIVKVTEDPDVSGALSPFDRPGLGPYLRKPLLNTWQVLVVPRLDRLTRSLDDFQEIWRLLETEGKALVSIGEQMDFGTEHGILMARQLVMFAEYERSLIRKRIKAAYDALVVNGQYPGNAFPFGYIPVKSETRGWRLEPHPIYSVIVAEICERLLAGESLGSICRWLDAEGIPTPRNVVRMHKGRKPLDAGAQWLVPSLTKILKSPAIIGMVTVNIEARRDETGKITRSAGPKALRDRDGNAIKRAEPLISRDTWEQVKRVLADNAERIGPKVARSPLLHVAYCSSCGSPLHLHQANTYKAAGKYRYYVCPSTMRNKGCKARSIDAGKLEAGLGKALLTVIGDQLMTEPVEEPAIDYSTQIAELAEAIGELASQMAIGRAMGRDVSDIQARQQVNEANLMKLAAEPTKPAQTTTRETGETWAACWQRCDWTERNTTLRRQGVRVEVAKLPEAARTEVRVSQENALLATFDL